MLFWDNPGDSSWLNKLVFGEEPRSRDPPHHVGEVRHGFALLVELEERWQVDDVLLRQPQLLLEDVPVPVDAALEGREKSRTRSGGPRWSPKPLHAGGEPKCSTSLQGFAPPWGGFCQKCQLSPETALSTCTYWFCCARMSLERTLLMVTRFISVPEYPANAKPRQNGAAPAGSSLQPRHQDSPPNPHCLSWRLRLLGVSVLNLWGNWVGRRRLPAGWSVGKVLSPILLPTGIVICCIFPLSSIKPKLQPPRRPPRAWGQPGVGLCPTGSHGGMETFSHPHRGWTMFKTTTKRYPKKAPICHHCSDK